MTHQFVMCVTELCSPLDPSPPPLCLILIVPPHHSSCDVISGIPKRSSLMSFAAWIPSSFRFFSICLDRAREALSSADIAHPILLTRRAATVEALTAATPTTHTHAHSHTHTHARAWGNEQRGGVCARRRRGGGWGKICSDLYQAHTSLRNKSRSFIVSFPP